MQEFDVPENKRDFKKIIWIAGGIAVLAGLTVLFFFLGRGSKETVKVGEISPSDLVAPTAPVEEKPLFSSDVLSWRNYFWPEKINTKYPGDWQLLEIQTGNVITGLKVVPPTGNPADEIFIGGKSATCATALQYAKNYCLKNKIQVPFYTDSQDEEVLAAFDLIFQNTILRLLFQNRLNRINFLQSYVNVWRESMTPSLIWIN